MTSPWTPNPAWRDPPRDCDLCPRLVNFREDNRKAFPDWYNGAVPALGADDPVLLVVGLAPGLRGANRTGRPFTGDYAGDLLYPTLLKFGFAKGRYGADPGDGLDLVHTVITNAVRCVPPQNKPTPEEARTCGQYLRGEIAAYKNLKVLVALGRVGHEAVLRALGLKLSQYAFGHGACHDLPNGDLPGGVRLYDSFHCSRYNTNTGRLTTEMFEDVFTAVREYVKGQR